MKKPICCLLAVLMGLLPSYAQAFGPKGHTLVGAIADKLLATKPQGAKIAALLKNVTLAEAARIPDDIKHWNHQVNPAWNWTKIPEVRQDMSDFLTANSNAPGGHGHNPDHHVFHYTPIFQFRAT